MKHSSLIILIALLLAACRPSAGQLTATAVMSEAQSLTAAPQPTSTSAPLPTQEPTPTSVPTRELVSIEVSGLSLDTVYQSEELGISLQYPSAWEVINASKMGGEANEIVVMEDYEKVMEDYINFTFSSINFSISVLGEATPANEAIDQTLCNTELQEPITRTEVIHGQDFFWVECLGFVNVDGQPLSRLFTGITNGHSTTLASTMIKSSSLETIRPIYEAVIGTIILPKE